ncbi:MAG: hydrolase [Planctomycetes bacterium]|nr:hydrolase [Planctomycetota bacterium]
METRIDWNPVREWLAAHRDEMVEDLERLCATNSGSDHLAGLVRMEQELIDYFKPLGMPCRKIWLPPYPSIDDLGRESEIQTSHALRWDWNGSDDAPRDRLLLSIHYDTVYGEDSSFQQCTRRVENDEQRLRGPGVIDAKGGIVVLRWAMLAATRFLDSRSLNVSIVLTPDEEVGSPSSINLWNEIAGEFAFAMLFEPALADGSLVSHRKGTGTFVFVLRGRSAHAGRNFHEGRNAILLAAKLATRVDSLNGQRDGVTINVGRIRGGDAVNVVPDLCVLRVNVRVTNHEDHQWIHECLHQIVSEMQSPTQGFSISMHGGIHSPPKTVDDATRDWMESIERVGKELSHSVRWKGSGGASDGNKLAALGLCCIDTFGPEGDLLHSDQEWVRTDSLPEKSLLSVAVIEEFRRTAARSK